MSPSELGHIAEQLKSLLIRMVTITSPTNTMGSVTDGPFRNTFLPDGLAPERPFTTLEEFSVLSQLPEEVTVRFTHVDLATKNIVVKRSTIPGIVDWALSCLYLSCWDYVLQRVFPGPRRQAEINSVRQPLRILLTVF
ncbi:hypothetical protein IW261DRAFT_1340915 [Armillaria novae-zelandiae]|uniref:Aminoglycoside phosphotransferase domain-containing protein n=1 Tax=Armillaria novae-zelandiae TaxID=153914 RepID=A0AA39P093_9AGAR|nr:hypothetical protein IW261DRAFT_1340915 [Armillaria novae-zelandiae]